MPSAPTAESQPKSAPPSSSTSARPSYVLSGADIGPSVIARVMHHLLARAQDPRRPALDEVAYETVYAEQLRLGDAEPGERKERDQAFITSVRRTLASAGPEEAAAVVERIVRHYTDEIAGHFDARVFALATRVVPAAVSVLLRGLALRDREPIDVGGRIVISGKTAVLQRLSQIGTVILAPTHVSNLDSLVLGSAIHRLGLPPFAYGAGINLFSSGVIGFFLRHLGAYTVDRKKTDPLYRETLKEYATVLLERGQHSLFFPGGTRSRSGAVEATVKKGLLGTAPVAFRNALAAGAARPAVFVVPCTLTYPLVLEASTLIGSYLRDEGGPQYIDGRDEFDRPRRLLDFIRGLRELNQHVHLRVGPALDWLGNPVDEAGVSHDPRGRPVDPRRYLLRGDKLWADAARDAEYTRFCAERVLQAFHRDNLALPTSVVAFVVFERLWQERGETNIFRFLRGLGPEARVPVSTIVADVTAALRHLEALEAADEIRRGPGLEAPADDIVAAALATFSRYHPQAVLERRGDSISVGDPGLLFYYRNRLEGHRLLGTPDRLPKGKPHLAAGAA